MPQWLRVGRPAGARFRRVEETVRAARLATICEDARCPNRYECWSEGHATFQILGRACTRRCGFCSVATGRPSGPDPAEPERIARAVRDLNMGYVVITSVARDDLSDGGAGHFAECIRQIRRWNPACRVEVLVPDFRADADAIAKVLEAGPEVFGHNLETCRRLQRRVRPQASYERSLEVFRISDGWKKTRRRSLPFLKTGLMAGLGETPEELAEAMEDAHRAGAEILTIGQYLQPAPSHLPVERYLAPAEFEALARLGRRIGFRAVQAGPRVRSSYRSAETFRQARNLCAGEGIIGS